MAEDFFLRFGALVNTVRINKSAVKQAAAALQGAIDPKASVNIDVGFTAKQATAVIQEAKRLAEQASKAFSSTAAKTGNLPKSNLGGFLSTFEGVKGATTALRQVLKQIDLNPKVFGDAKALKEQVFVLLQDLKLLKKEGSEVIKINVDAQALVKAEEQAKSLENRLKARRNVFGQALGTFIRQRSLQEEQRAAITPGYRPKSREEIRKEALTIFDPNTAKDLNEYNSLINRVRSGIEKIKTETFEQAQAVKQITVAEKQREANANKLFAIEQQIQKTLAAEVSLENARASAAAKTGAAFRPRTPAEIEKDIRGSASGVFDRASRGESISSLERKKIESSLRNRQVSAQQETKSISQALTKSEQDKNKSIEYQIRLRQVLGRLIDNEVKLEEKRVALSKLTGSPIAGRSRTDIFSDIESKFSSSLKPGFVPTGIDRAKDKSVAAAVVQAQRNNEKQLNQEISNRQKILDDEAKKRQKILENIRATFVALEKLNSEASRRAGAAYSPLSKKELAQKSLQTLNIQDRSEIDKLTGGALDAKLESTKKKTREAKQAIVEFKTALREVESGRQSSLQFISRFGDGFQRLGAQVAIATQRIAGYVIGATGIYGTISFVQSATREFFRLEAQLTKIDQVLGNFGANSKQIQGLSGFIKDLSVELGIAPTEIASGIATLAQAGYTDIEGLKKAITSISQAQLGPSFGDQAQTIDGLIATYRQFNITLDDTSKAIDIVNQFSKDYAVESKDLFEIIKRGGSAFAVLGGSFEEFVGIASILRQQTRESASVIGTSLKTITTSLFRPKFEKFLEQNDPAVLEELNPQRRLLATAKLFRDRFAGSEEKTSALGQFIDTRNSSRVLALFQAIIENADKLQESTDKAAGSTVRDAQRRLEDVGKAIDRARQSLSIAAQGLIDNPFIAGLVKTFSNIASIGGSAIASAAPVAAPALAGAAIYGLTSVIKSSIQTFFAVIRSSDRLRDGLTLVNGTLRILNNTIATSKFGGGGTIISGGAGGAPSVGAGGGRGGIGSRIGGFIKSPVGLAVAGSTAIGVADIAAENIRNNSGGKSAVADSLNVLSGAATGALLGSIVPGIGTVVGGLAGFALSLTNVISTTKAQEEQAKALIKAQEDTRKFAETRRFISTGKAQENFQAQFAQELQGTFFSTTQNTTQKQFDFGVSAFREQILSGKPNAAEIEKIVSARQSSLSAADAKRITASIIGDQADQARKLFQESFRNAKLRASRAGLVGPEVDKFIKGELEKLLTFGGIKPSAVELDKIFSELQKSSGSAVFGLQDLNEAVKDFSLAISIASSSAVSTLKSISDQAKRSEAISELIRTSASSLSEIFDPQRFVAAQRAQLPSGTTDDVLKAFGFKGILTPELKKTVDGINRFATNFRATATPAKVGFLQRDTLGEDLQTTVDDQGTELTKITRTFEEQVDELYGFIGDIDKQFLKQLKVQPLDLKKFAELLISGEDVNIGEVITGVSKIREEYERAIQEQIKRQNDQLKEANALAELQNQKRKQYLDVEQQIASTRQQANELILQTRRGAGLISESQFFAGRERFAPSLNTPFAALQASGITTNSNPVIPQDSVNLINYVQRSLVRFGDLVRSGQFNTKDLSKLSQFGNSINKTISSFSLGIKNVNTAETDPTRFIADISRALNEAKSAGYELFDAFKTGAQNVTDAVSSRLQNLQSEIQSRRAFFGDLFSTAFGGTPEQNLIAQQELVDVRGALNSIITGLQSRGVKNFAVGSETATPETQRFIQTQVEDLAARGLLQPLIKLLSSAGSAEFGATGVAGGDLLKLITEVMGAKVAEISGFGGMTGLTDLTTKLEVAISDYKVAIENQILVQQESKRIIEAQSALITDASSQLAKAIEGIPETINIKISGMDTVELKMNLSSAEQDIQAIKDSVAMSLKNYFENALRNAGLNLGSLGPPSNSVGGSGLANP